MATTKHRTDASTPVDELPPLHVTKSGIPDDEHLPERRPTRNEIDQAVFRRRARLVVAVVAVLVALIAVSGGVVASHWQPPPSTRGWTPTQSVF